MKLSMSLLGKYLEKFHPECHITKDALTISGVRFLSASVGKFSGEYVYIGDAREYYQDERYKDALLLTSGQNQILCHGADYEELLNEVLSAFEYYNHAEQELMMKASLKKPLEELVDVMGHIYDGAILVFDMDGNLLASTHEEQIEKDELYPELKRNKRIELISMSRIFVHGDGSITHDLTDYPQRLFLANEKRGSVSMYLNNQHERIGFLMLLPDSELSASAALCLEEMFGRYSIMAKEFTDTDSMLAPRRTILESLLNGIIPEKEILFQLEQAIHMEADGRILLVENLGIQNYTVYRMVGRALEPLKNQISCEKDTGYVVFASTSEMPKIIQCLEEQMVYGKYKMGLSMAIQSAEQIPVAYRQAGFAISHGKGEGIYRCQDFALEYLMQNLRNTDMAMELLHPLIGILRHYDQDHHTDLFMTLCAYLQNGCSQIQTAQQLHIHLNTLKYRIKRMEELGQVDFSQEREVFYLRLSMELLGKMESSG